jgi:hypothetical protein
MRLHARSLGWVPLVLAFFGFLVVGCGDDDSASPDTAQQASTTTAEAPVDVAGNGTVTVSVTVSGIESAVGNQLAGVLLRGPEATDPDRNGVGGFAATVDADPFSTTEQVRQPNPDPDAVGPFPYVTEDLLIVEPGTYTLVLWLAPDLGPYSRWVPAATAGLAGCRTSFVVGDGTTFEIEVHGMPHPGRGRHEPLHHPVGRRRRAGASWRRCAGTGSTSTPGRFGPMCRSSIEGHLSEGSRNRTAGARWRCRVGGPRLPSYTPRSDPKRRQVTATTTHRATHPSHPPRSLDRRARTANAG